MLSMLPNENQYNYQSLWRRFVEGAKYVWGRLTGQPVILDIPVEIPEYLRLQEVRLNPILSDSYEIEPFIWSHLL